MKLLKNIFVVSIAFGLFFLSLNAVSHVESSDLGKYLAIRLSLETENSANHAINLGKKLHDPLIVYEIMELFFRVGDKAERKKIVHYLSTQCALVDGQGRSVLHLAAQLNDQAKAYKIMNFLFQIHGTKYINQQDNSGMAPLHIAAQAGHVKIICYLLEKGADVALSDKSNKVPFERAYDAGYQEIGDYLSELYQDTVMQTYSGLSYKACNSNSRIFCSSKL